MELDGLGVEVASNKHRVAEICRQNGARNITTANDAETRLKLWKGRKAAFAAAGKISPNYLCKMG